MRIRGRRPWLVLVLLLLIGMASNRVGMHLCETYHYRAALAALAQRDFRHASNHLDQCLEIDASDLTARLLAAQTARRRRDYAAAFEHLRACAKGHGLEESLALERRLLQVQEGDLGNVDELLAFCADHADVPETPLILEACIEGLLRAGVPAFLRGMVADAGATRPEMVRVRHAIDRWLERRSAPADQAQGLVWRARAHALVNDQRQTLADLHRALELDPQSFEARLYLALFTSDQCPAEAAMDLRALRVRDPADDRVRLALATILRNLGELAEARQILDELLAAQPDNRLALAERGYVGLELQEPADAERWLVRAVRLAPDDPQLNLAMAACLRMANRPAEAQPYRERFEQLDAERRRMRDATLRKPRPTR